MPNPIRVITVCLDKDNHVDQLAAVAASRVPEPTNGPVTHFATGRRWRVGELLHCAERRTAGGPLRLLDLDATTAAGQAAHHHRFQVWRRVVADTKPAEPYWVFAHRHANIPDRYSLHQAQQDYLAQPRVVAMRIYNLLPQRLMDLPTSHLEVLQAGEDIYLHLGGLGAVPGHAMLTLTGQFLRPANDRLSGHLDYLAQAHLCLNQLRPDDKLVALAAA